MSDLSTPPPPGGETPHWTARFGKSIIFVILTAVAVGIYLALTIPVAVFPETDFPRVVVGVDNGVALLAKPNNSAPRTFAARS